MQKEGSVYYDKQFAIGWKIYIKKHKLLHDIVVPYMKGKILDLGCGFAPYHTPEMNILGVDYSEWAIAKAKELNPSGKYIVDNLYFHNNEKKFYDTVCLFEILEHVHKIALIAWKSFSYVKPGGHLLITVPIDMRIKEHAHPTWDENKLQYLIGGMGPRWQYKVVNKWWFLIIEKLQPFIND